MGMVWSLSCLSGTITPSTCSGLTPPTQLTRPHGVVQEEPAELTLESQPMLRPTPHGPMLPSPPLDSERLDPPMEMIQHQAQPQPQAVTTSMVMPAPPLTMTTAM